MIRCRAALAFGLLAVATAASAADGEGVGAPTAVPSAQELADPEWIAQGRKRFVSACALCHGQEGEAGKVKSFKQRPGWDPLKIHNAIANGSARAGNVMPAWKGSIADAEIWKIVAYVKSLTPVERIEPSGKP